MSHAGLTSRLLAREIWALPRLLRGGKQVEQSARLTGYRSIDVVTDGDKVVTLLLLPRHAYVGHVAALRPLEYLPCGELVELVVNPPG